MQLFGRKKIQAFGLEISNSSIKIGQLIKTKDGLVPTGFAEVRLPEKVINNNLIVSSKILADNVIRALTKAQTINSKFVVCSIPEAKSFVRTITIPSMPHDEIDGAIPYELEQDIPIPVDQVYLDWQIRKETPENIELLVMAAPRDFVDSLVEALNQAELVPVAMELESLATARALIAPSSADKPVLIADLATQQTSFIIVDNGSVQYTSSIPVAGKAFTESIARNLGVSNAEAEKIKLAAGLTSETKQGNIRSSILPILDNMIDEIKNVIRFFEEHDASHRMIERIILCGGSSNLLGLADYISARINLGTTKNPITVALGDPQINITKTGKASANSGPPDLLSYTTVIGLALRGALNETD